MDRVLVLDLEQLRDLDADLDLGMMVAYTCGEQKKPTQKKAGGRLRKDLDK